MSDLPTRLAEWNAALAEAEAMSAKWKADAMRLRHGLRRRALLGCIRWLDGWIARGRRWRNEDLADD